MTDFDRSLGRYDRRPIDVWCSNKECRWHAEPMTVTYEEEYGMGWTTPEECPEKGCGGEWLFDAPLEEDEEDEEC